MIGSFVMVIFVMAYAANDAYADTTTYYVDAAGGSDSDRGTSEAEAWASIGRVNDVDLGPGDRVSLKGGQAFDGTLSIGPEDAGTAENPLKVGSYGSGQAIISAGKGKGISVYNAGGVEVSNLKVKGYDAGNRKSGVEIYTDLGKSSKLKHVYVNNVEVSGFGKSGVELGAWPSDGTKSGFSDVRITNVSAHDNADAGIQSYGYWDPSATGWAHENVYVGNSKAYDNKGIAGKGSNSGSGIVLGDVNGAKIERSVAYGNGKNNDFRGGGPVGIWTWDSNRVIIQHNESYNNKTSTIDGGGFDLDGGVTNSVMQYNYSHGNAGAGYLLYQFSGARPFGNNTVRYNVSENDGRYYYMGGIFAGGGVSDTEIYNNTIYTSPRANGGQSFAAKVGEARDLRFRNNLFVTVGGMPLLDISRDRPGLRFQGNGYWSSGEKFTIKHGGSTYDGLATWRDAKGQEKYGSRDTGLRANPRLNDPGNGGTIGNPGRLSSLISYKLGRGSSMIDAGLNLERLFNVDPGPTDFYGGKISQGNGPDVGAHEAAPRSVNTAPKIGGLRPAPRAKIRDRTPTVRATVSDVETNFSKRNVKLFVDGRRIGNFRYNRTRDRLKYTSPRKRAGWHRVKIVATDSKGLVKKRSWRFKILR